MLLSMANSLFCSKCGVAVANDSQYCFKCGSEIYKAPTPSAVPYQLDVKFRPRGFIIFTTLEYSLHERVWLLDGGFQKLHQFVNELCDLAYDTSCKVAPSDSENRCYDTVSDLHFHRYDSDYYPIDGYESIFVEFSDSIPSPLGNLGVGPDATDFGRSMRIFMGRIEHDPTHGRNNYADTKPPRLRKSKLVEKWGISVAHRFVNGHPTLNFDYSLTAFPLSWQSEHTANYKGLLTTLGIEAVTGYNIKTLPQVRKALSDLNGNIGFHFFHEEVWRPSQHIWQPYLNVTIKTGWLSSEERQIYFEASTDNRPPSIGRGC